MDLLQHPDEWWREKEMKYIHYIQMNGGEKRI